MDAKEAMLTAALKKLEEAKSYTLKSLRELSRRTIDEINEIEGRGKKMGRTIRKTSTVQIRIQIEKQRGNSWEVIDETAIECEDEADAAELFKEIEDFVEGGDSE